MLAGWHSRGAGGSARPVSPRDVDATMALWLDSSDASTFTQVGGVVSEWRDKSGNARHGVQANNALRPRIDTATINGLPVVRKTAVNQTMTVDMGSVLINEFTAFWVARFTSTLSYLRMMTTTNAAQNYNGGALIYRKSNNTWATYPLFSSGGVLDGYGTSAQDVAYQFGLFRPVPNGIASVHVSRTSFNLGAMFAHAVQNTHLHPLSGDNFSVRAGQSGNLDFAELVIYEGAVSAADRLLIQDYNTAKWGVI